MAHSYCTDKRLGATVHMRICGSMHSIRALINIPGMHCNCAGELMTWGTANQTTYNMQLTRQLVKLGRFTRAWLVLCRRMEFFAHRARMEPALQLPVGGECHFRPDFVPNHIPAQQILTTWPSTANAILPRHPLGPFYWLVVRQDDHHGLSGYSVLSTWCDSTAIYSARVPSSRSSQGCRAWA